MEKQEIENIVRGMKSKEDFLDALNCLKKDDYKEKVIPFTMQQLNFYSNPNHTKGRYRKFTIPKKSGGVRDITAPRKHTYMQMLHYVNVMLQSIYEPSAHTMGFVNGKCIVDNATPHIGKPYVYNIDLKDFFPSIEQRRICRRLQVFPFNFSKDIAYIFAGLCCMRVPGENGEHKYVLPQGSPASPTLTNLTCDKLDFLLGGLARRFRVTYTRYADDITFSSSHNVFQKSSDFCIELNRIITDQNFTVNPKKTRLCRLGSRQEVTGLIVSQTKVNVPRQYIRDLRSILFIWDKYGTSVANARLAKYNSEKYAVRKGKNVENVVYGKLQFLKMVKGESDSTYMTLYKKFESILSKYSTPKHISVGGVEYQETFSIATYEKTLGVEINLGLSKGGHRYAVCKTLGKKSGRLVSLAKDVSSEAKKEDLQISVCKNTENKEFLLIHPVYNVISEDVNLDQLEQELDKILS